MSAVVVDIGPPGPEQIRRYAQSQAYRLLQSRGIPPEERTVAAAFVPAARTNIDAVSRWLYDCVSHLAGLRAYELDRDKSLPLELGLVFDDRLEEYFDVHIYFE